MPILSFLSRAWATLTAKKPKPPVRPTLRPYTVLGYVRTGYTS